MWKLSEYQDTRRPSSSPNNFFKGAPLKEAASGGADTNCNPGTSHTNTKTKEVPVQEGHFRRPPPEGRDNEHYFRPPKGDNVSVIAYINVLYVVNLIKDNAHYTPIATALQWIQQNLSPLMPLDSNAKQAIYT